MKRWITCVFLPLLLACESDVITYGIQQGFYQGSFLLRTQDIEEQLKKTDDIDPVTTKYLRLSQEILAFAEKKGMKVGKSYRRFIRLDRDWVTQIVRAAHKDKLESHLFEFPVVGSLPYKGYFKEESAKKEEMKLMNRGFDTLRRKVPAFSGLGYFPDPLISTMFIKEPLFIELIFHELTHLSFYFPSKADFNEAFASWLGMELALEFMRSKERYSTQLSTFSEFLESTSKNRLALSRFVGRIKKKGQEIYSQENKEDLQSRREMYFSWIQEEVSKNSYLKKLFKGYAWNNAVVMSLGSYYELIPQIQAYARREALKPMDFLDRVIKNGEEIVPQIVNQL